MRDLEENLDPLQWGDDSFGLQYPRISNRPLVARVVRLTAQPAAPPASPFRMISPNFDCLCLVLMCDKPGECLLSSSMILSLLEH